MTRAPSAIGWSGRSIVSVCCVNRLTPLRTALAVACQRVAFAIPPGIAADVLSDRHVGRPWWKRNGHKFSLASPIFVLRGLDSSRRDLTQSTTQSRDLRKAGHYQLSIGADIAAVRSAAFQFWSGCRG